MYAPFKNVVEEETSDSDVLVVPVQSVAKVSPIKNLLLVSVSVMLLFLASQSMDKLQSSIHFSGGLGTTALAVLNGANVLVSLLVAVLLIRRFGPKIVLLTSMFGYVAYIAVNLHATWYTLIPVAVVDGMCTATLYASLWTYIGTLGSQYSEKSGLSLDIVNARFYGLFFMFIQSSSVWGNLISFEVLHQQQNMSANASDEYCGFNFCDDEVSKDDSNFQELPENFYLLCGIYIGVSVLAIFVMIFADRQEPKGTDGVSVLQSLTVTGKKLKDPLMILVLPITLYGGLQIAFIGGDYTKAYITCEFGVSYVGYVFICFGAVSTVFCLVGGHLVKLVGRRAVFGVATLMDIAVYACLSFNQFRESEGLVLLFVLIGCLGITSGVWQAQVKALYGSLFADCQEVAFSMLGVFEGLGIALGYVYSAELCTRPKLFVLLGLLLLGMICYAVVEVREARRLRRTESLSAVFRD